MKVKEASQLLGITERNLRIALKKNVFPFGKAIQSTDKSYIYYINDELLYKYLRGEIN